MMFELTIGIDPGLTGAIALYDSRGMIVDLHDVPTVTKKTNKKNVRHVDYPQVCMIIARMRLSGARVCYIERVSAMPGQGVTGMFRLGEVFGALQAAAHAAGLDVRLVSPQAWKKHYSLIKADKYASLELARKKYGTENLERKKDHNRAEACLIAEYGHQDQKNLHD